MTQPDKYVPPGSSNYDGLAAFAGKTQEDWEAENRAAMEARFGDALAGVIILLEQIPIIGDLVEILTGVEDGDLNDLGTAANNFKKFLGDQWGGLFKAIEDALGGVQKAAVEFGEFVGAVVTGLGGAVLGTASAVGQAVNDGFKFLQDLTDGFFNAIFGTNQVNKTPADVSTAAGAVVSNTNTAATNAGQALGEIGSMILAVPATIVGGIVTTAAHVGEAIAGAVKGVQDTWTGFWNGVFGIPNVEGEVRRAEDLYLAASALLQKVLNALANGNTAIAVNYETASKGAAVLYSLRGGYTVDTISASGTWTKPVGLAEVFVALFGAGAAGSPGTASVSGKLGSGGGGGSAGKVIAAQLDPKSIPDTVECTVGDGTSTTPPATSFGSIISTSNAFESYVSTPLGLMQTFAKSSAGGVGGTGGTIGTSGRTTQFGLLGGTAGVPGTSGFPDGGNGYPGLTGLNFGLCQTGGSGGGGGGGTNAFGGNGGTGGAGGAPGGGGGGGGSSAINCIPGDGGNGGNGLIIVIYKLASDVLPV